MRKIYLALSLLLCSCVEINKGESNAKEFVKSKIDATNIESIEVEPCDSILCDIPVEMKYISLLKGESTEDEFIELLTDVNNSVASKGVLKFQNREAWLRKAYTVVVKTKDGRTTDIQVIMDTDGVTPRITGGEIQKKINEYMEAL